MRYVHPVLIVVLSWYVLAWALHSPIVPYPHLVFSHLAESLIMGTTFMHLFHSLYRILTGMAFALTFAIPTGMLAGRFKKLDHMVSPVLYLLYPLPKIAFLPVFMVLFGIGDLSKIILIAVIIFFPAAITIRDGIREIPTQYLELARAFHLKPAEVIREILWPAVLPRIFSSLRITVGISLSVLFISENYAARFGLGYYIMNNWVMAQYVGMYSGIVLLSLLGLGLYALIDFCERLAIPDAAR